MGAYCTYNTDIGAITIVSDGEAVVALLFGQIKHCLLFNAANGGGKPDAVTERTATLLEEYFMGKRREFDLPLRPRGTPFQLAVWGELAKIPYGETRSYKQIAEAIGNPKACRAVGRANNKNPIPIFIPCHRVIGADGGLTGYAGGVRIKERLLKLEGL